MEERVQISMLVDLYGELLTEKQRDILNLYFNEDFSLAEIAEINHTSRQAIHDTIKRCHKLLLDYELKLRLMEKSIKVSNIKNVILTKIEALEKCNSESERLSLVYQIKNEIENI